MKVINFYGGPGTGKSTTAANLFYHMKMRGYNCELVREYAKDLTWDESWEKLKDQSLVFAKQHHRIFCIKDKVDYIITDSPLLLTLIYKNGMPSSFTSYVLDMYDTYDNVNFFIKRTKEYNPVGRSQDEVEAIALDNKTRCMLKKYGIQINEIEVDTYIDKLINLIVND